MMWNNASHHHTKKNVILFSFGSWNHFLSLHVVRKLDAMKKKFDFVNKKVLMPFIMIYMFVNCICTRYINAHIYQGFKPRLHDSTPKF
jgi:hypothetical protein